MQAVEHRQGCQRNPDASRCLHRPPPPASREGRYGGAGGASGASALRGPCVRHGCVGSVEQPHAARYRAPGLNSLVCSSADRGRSGGKAGPGQSTVRTGTSGRNRPYAPRGKKPKVLDGRVPASHTAVAPPSSARCRVRRGRPAAKRWTTAVPDLLGHRRALYNARLGIRHGAQRTTSPLHTGPGAPIHHDRPRTPSGGSIACRRWLGRPPGVLASDELMRSSTITKPPLETTVDPRTASSPPNKRGS